MGASTSSRVLWLAAVALAVADSLFWLFYPRGVVTVAGETKFTQGEPAESVSTERAQSVFDIEGASMLPVAILPPLLLGLALAPWVRRPRRARMMAAFALSGVTVVSLASIGVTYLPAVLVSWLAVARTPVS